MYPRKDKDKANGTNLDQYESYYEGITENGSQNFTQHTLLLLN